MMDTAYRILVVDDDADILALMQGVLSRNGITPETARSAAEAEKALETFPADLIVLDLMMEGEDGLSFCRRLRARSNVPIIMLTALAEDVDRIVGLEVGADDYLGKPFNPRELIARIKSVLRRSRDQTLMGKQAATSSSPSAPSAFRRRRCRLSLRMIRLCI